MTKRQRHGIPAHAFAVFGPDRFGRLAERFARWFGTPQFIIGQTAIVAVWIGLNVAAVSLRWDAYPFILLNLMFSTQAAYAAPLILLAETRQADRDKAQAVADAQHQEQLASAHAKLLSENTRLTAEVHSALEAMERIIAHLDDLN